MDFQSLIKEIRSFKRKNEGKSALVIVPAENFADNKITGALLTKAHADMVISEGSAIIKQFDTIYVVNPTTGGEFELWREGVFANYIKRAGRMTIMGIELNELTQSVAPASDAASETVFNIQALSTTEVPVNSTLEA